MNNTDPTSFKSILAGVKKLREQNNGDEASQPQIERTKVNNDDVNRPTSGRQNVSVVNAFNQERMATDSASNDKGNKRPFQGSGPGKTVLVNSTQKENPLLNSLKNTNWRYVASKSGTKIYYDYLVRGRSILFLTLSYHKLYADYITRRMAPLAKEEDDILIFVVDDTNSDEAINEITKMCMFNGFTLLVAFNFEQAAKYIEHLNAS